MAARLASLIEGSVVKDQGAAPGCALISIFPLTNGMKSFSRSYGRLCDHLSTAKARRVPWTRLPLNRATRMRREVGPTSTRNGPNVCFLLGSGGP